ncbi:MAG: hypothetical protein ABIJ95_13085, partial [Pseudomonadota bacterium]
MQEQAIGHDRTERGPQAPCLGGEALDAIGKRPVFVWCEAREQRVSTTVCNRCGRCELTTGKDGKIMAMQKVCDIDPNKSIKGDEPLAPGFTKPGMFEKRFLYAGAPAVVVTVSIMTTPEPLEEDGIPTDILMTDVHPDSGRKVAGRALAQALKLLGYRKPREKKAPATAKKGKKKTQAPPEWTLG